LYVLFKFSFNKFIKKKKLKTKKEKNKL